MAGANGIAVMEKVEKPVFDFSRTSYKDGRKLSRIQQQIRHLQKRVDAAEPDDDITPLLDEMDALTDEAEMLVLRPLVSLPREWLTGDAPERIDYSDHECIRWIKLDKFGAIVAAVAEQKTGN